MTSLPLAAALLALAVPPPDLPEVLARWRGGSLTRERFESRYDPQGRARARGPEALRIGICKAVYREIYAPRGRQQGLERDPALRAELEQWRTRALAARYRREHAPPEPTPAELRALHEQQWPGPGTLDLDVLFVRCPLRASQRPECAARMQALSARVERGESLADVIAEERGRSGEASGSFTALPMTLLQADLAQAAASLPLGQLSAVIESVPGLFRLRVRQRRPAPRPEFAAQEPRLRRLWAQQKEEEALRRLRAELGLPADAEPNRVYAAAARAAGQERSADFLAAEQDFLEWLLADGAFLADASVLPSDEALRQSLEQQKPRFTRWWLRVATLAVGADRPAALRRAAEIADRLDAAAQPGEALARLADLQASELGPITLDELRRSQPQVQRALANAGPGDWRGPIPLATPDLRTAAPSGAEQAPYLSLAFVFVERRELPSLAEVRPALLQDHRGRIGDGVEPFLRLVGRFWDLELLVP